MKMHASKIGAAMLGYYGALHAVCLPISLLAGDAGNTRASTELAASRGQASLNLARTDLGTHLEIAGASADPAAAGALLRDDDPLGYRLPVGTTSMILSLPKIEVLHRFNFINLTAGGKVSVSVSSAKLPADSPRWQAVATGKDFSPSGSEVVHCDLGSTEARYVKLDFDVQTAGSIDTFGLFGVPTLANQADASAQYASIRKVAVAAGDRALLYNYALSSDHAGVIMVSPGENLQEAQKMADGDVGTSFSFRADDARPMAVIDLGESRPVSRIGMSFRAGPGHLDIYLLPDPEKRGGSLQRVSNSDATGTRSIQEIIAGNFPAGYEPIISTETGTQTGLNRISGNANEKVGRYLVMVYKPSGTPVAVGGQTASVDFKDFKDFKDTGAPAATGAPANGYSGPPLDVSEISVFGATPPGTYTYTDFVPNVPNSGNTTTTGGQVPNPPILPPGQGGDVVTP